MVTDQQVRLLMKAIEEQVPLTTAAAQAGMSAPTVRKLRWSDVFGPLVGEFKVYSATTLNYRPQGLYLNLRSSSSCLLAGFGGGRCSRPVDHFGRLWLSLFQCQMSLTSGIVSNGK